MLTYVTILMPAGQPIKARMRSAKSTTKKIIKQKMKTSIFLIVENGIIDYIKKNYKIPPPASYSTVL